jgi:peptidyl-prolyl cis-trans isomerase SurA
MMKLGTLPRAAIALAASVASVIAAAQSAGQTAATPGGLNIPLNPQFVGPAEPGVRKATAIVNGEVITETNIDQRLALVIASNNNVSLPAEELQRVRAQILRNLIDEALQIQAATQRDITVEPREIDAALLRVAERGGQTRAAFVEQLRSLGSSEASLRRQIHAELAWGRLQGRFIAPFINVSDDEAQAVVDRLNASRGAREYRVGEIFLSATPENAAEVQANAARIFDQLRAGASFQAYARQYSEATTAALGGDLGWIRPELLPEPLAQALSQMAVNTLSPPIAVPGGYSIIALADTRQVLMPDARDARLSLLQMSIGFPAGTTEAQAAPAIERLITTSQTMGGCGGAQAAATSIGAEVVANDQIRAGDLPAQLQEMLLNLGIGQATRPFGSLDTRVSVLVLCGRDDPQQAAGPNLESVLDSLTEERINRRAQRFLRDLRRDAIIDYR